MRPTTRGLLLALVAALAGSVALSGATVASATREVRQPYTWHNAVTGGGGGYVPGIVFNAKQPGLAFARTDIGGAYRWDPRTKSWVQLLSWVGPDDWNSSGVESVATDPVDPNRLYLAVGTYTNVFTKQNGAILRSTDQGRTFRRTDLPFKNGGNMPGRSMGERLVIDPNDDSVLYFGTRSGNGLWRSTDFGVTWSQVTSFTAVGDYVEIPGNIYGGDPDGIVWEAFDQTSGRRGHASRSIFAGVATRNGPSIWHSADGGATWAAVPGQPVGLLPQHGIWSNGKLYVSFSNGAGPFDGTSGDVWKLDTATGAWTRISPVPSTDTANDFFGYGGLTIDAQHPNTIMVAALNSWFPDTIFFRSTDDGATWTRIWDFTSYPDRSFRFTLDASAAPWLDFGVKDPTPPSPQVKLGWMVSSLVIDPFDSNHLFYGTGATIFGVNDLTNWDRGTQIHVAVAAKGVEETAVQDVISPPAGAHLLSGLGDIGGFRHDDLTRTPAEMFTNPIFSTTTSLDFAGRSPGFIVRVGFPASGTAAGFSSDGGTTWTPAATVPANASGGTVAAAADGSRVVWSPGGAGVSFSTDMGATWTASAGVPAGAMVRSDRVDASRFYAFSNGTVFVSTDGGATFAASPATGLSVFGKIEAAPGRAGDLWLAGDPGDAGGPAGLWHSTDGGTTFSRLSNVAMADVIGFGKAAPGRRYPALFTSAVIGGVHGLFRSDDMGARWVRINDDQHQFASTNQAITGDPRIFGRVYVTTNGFGIVYGDLRSQRGHD